LEQLKQHGIKESYLTVAEFNQLETNLLMQTDFDLNWCSPVLLLQVFLQNLLEVIFISQTVWDLSHKFLSMFYRTPIRILETDWKQLSLGCILAAYCLARGHKRTPQELMLWALTMTSVDQRFLEDLVNEILAFTDNKAEE